MGVSTNHENESKVISLTTDETDKLQQNGWIYNTEDDVLVLYDREENMYSVYENISTRTPCCGWELKLNHDGVDYDEV